MTYTSAENLYDLAEYATNRDWNYTRKHDIKSIRFKNDEWNKLSGRIKRSLAALFEINRKGIKSGIPRFYFARFLLKRDENLPDGQVGDLVFALWEEDGEYIQMVQPSVGKLVANFLKEEPDHPHARTITAELDKIREAYGERIKNGEWLR